MYKFYKKEVSSKRTVQAKTAMEENVKHQIVANDLVRRLLNTSEELGAEYRGAVVDQYAQELSYSGYSMEQIRKVIVNGIKGYEGRNRRRRKDGRSIRSTAKSSRGSRYLNKLTSKTSWYKRKKRSNAEEYGAGKKGSNKKNTQEQMEHKTVLFIENTKDGELAKRMKELTRRIAPSIGFGIKIVERTGATLRSKFPLTNLWEGAKCGRIDCVTCEQGAEVLPTCTRTSVVYENVCEECNPTAGAKELGSIKDDVPTIYVGETSRTLYERSKEHWKDCENKPEKSHIAKHQEMVHQGAAPKFKMRSCEVP